MRLLNKIRTAWNTITRPTVDLGSEEMMEWLGISAESKKAINEITYFTCIKMLSETMGKLPLKYYQQTERGKIRAEPNRAAWLLMNRPNKIMTPATFWATVEYNCEHYGNAYVWIQTRFTRQKYGGSYEIIGFYIMQSNYVQVLMDDAGIFGDKGGLYYQYSDPRTGELYIFRQDNVMHFKTWCSIDGVLGCSVKDMLEGSISGTIESQDYLNRLYKQGLTASMALQYTADLDDKQRRALERKYSSLLSGAKNAGKVVAVPIGMQLQPLNIKLSDAQFFELKKYTALQIAAAFGIKPNQINNYEKSSYANSETQQLAFLVDTMAYRLAQYEQEINYKCLTEAERKQGYYFKFNEKAILRTDSKTQRENIVAYTTNGIYQVNDARDLLDMEHVEGGDVNMVNGTYTPITQIGAAYGTVQEGGEGDGGN